MKMDLEMMRLADQAEARSATIGTATPPDFWEEVRNEILRLAVQIAEAEDA